MVFGKLLEQFSKKTIFATDIGGKKAMRDSDLEAAYFQISSAIIGHRDLPTILDLVVRESLHCLRANRTSIFFIGPKSETLRAQFVHALNPRYEKVGLVEEKQVAKKTLIQAKSFFLQEAKDFAEFFESRKQGWKVSSLLSIPLSSRGKPAGALSVVLINEKRRFSARDLKYLFFFGNLASLAMENAHLMEELNKEISARKTFEQCLDNILCRMQGLFGKEIWHNEERLANSPTVQLATQNRPFGNQTWKKVNWVDGSLILAGK